MSNKIYIHKVRKKEISGVTGSDRLLNLVQQNVLGDIKNKLIKLANEVTDAVNDLNAEDQILEKVIKDKEKK